MNILAIVIVTTLSLLIPLSTSTVSASLEGNGTFQVAEKCVGDEIIPCVDEEGIIIYYCNDPRSDNLRACFPSGNPAEDLAMGQKQLKMLQEREQHQPPDMTELPQCDFTIKDIVLPCVSDDIDGNPFVTYSCDDPQYLIDPTNGSGCLVPEGDSNSNSNISSESICDSDPLTPAISCDEYGKMVEKELEKANGNGNENNTFMNLTSFNTMK